MWPWARTIQALTALPENFSVTVLSFSIITESLPNATPGIAYGPVTLQSAGEDGSRARRHDNAQESDGPAKGLKLSSAGVLSGTPSAKLLAGSIHHRSGDGDCDNTQR